jgi:hypothetical protein
MNLRIPLILVTAVAAFGMVSGRPPAAFGGCLPGCKICLLDVCSEAPQSRPGELKSGSGQQQPPPPFPGDPNDNAGKLDWEAKHLKPSDTSAPVLEWAGMSKRDFYLAFINDFIAAGYCADVKNIPKQIKDLPTCYRHCHGITDGRMSDCEDKCYLTASERDERNRKENDLLKRLEEANSNINKSKYNCSTP